MANKIVSLAFALLLFMAGNMWSQLVDLPGGSFSSPQSTATQGRIRSMADDMLRPDAYSNVKFDKWYGFTSFSNLFDAKVMMGFASNIGNMYFASFYRGSFWENVPNLNYTKQALPFSGGEKTFPVYDSTFDMEGVHPNNTIGVLIGIADMGFRFSFNSRYRLFNENDIALGSVSPDVYKSYQMATGNINPQLVWAMAKNLTAKGIKPYAGVDLVFSNYYEKFEKYDPVNGTTNGQEVRTSRNFFEQRLIIGMGGYTLFSKDGFSLSADIEYQLRLRTYSNEYHYHDGAANRIAAINGLNTSSRLTENSYMYNSAMPALSGSWNGENLALRFQLRLPASLTNENETEMDGSAGSLVKTGIFANKTTLLLDPQLRLAAKWTAVSQLSVNVGGAVRALPMTIEHVDEDNSATQSMTFTGAQTELSLGVSFSPTDRLSFEATCGIDPVNNTVNVFHTGNGLFTFGNILVSLQF